MKIKKQTRKDKTWIDETGTEVPFNLIKKKEIVQEDVTYAIAKAAIKQNSLLAKLKASIIALVDKAVAAITKEYSGKKTEFKGNYTLYNFDRSIKVQVKVSQPIKFDDLIIAQAKNLLDEFLGEGISGKNEFIKQIVLSAFETRRGQMDTRKVLGLKRYADRIDDKRYKDAMQLIDEAIRRPESATYYNVWVRNDQGRYEAVHLDFARL